MSLGQVTAEGSLTITPTDDRDWVYVASLVSDATTD